MSRPRSGGGGRARSFGGRGAGARAAALLVASLSGLQGLAPPHGGAQAPAPRLQPQRGESSEADGGAEEVRRLFRQAVALGVTERELGRLVESAREAGFTEGELQRVLRLVAGAKLGGLPHFDLLNKLREGLAKRANPDAIQAALEHKAQSLRRAKGLADSLILEGWSTRDYSLTVQMLSDALDAGASPADILRSVREGKPCGEGMPDLRSAFRSGGAAK